MGYYHLIFALSYTHTHKNKTDTCAYDVLVLFCTIYFLKKCTEERKKKREKENENDKLHFLIIKAKHAHKES